VTGNIAGRVVGRADLLRLLHLGIDRETAAALTGFLPSGVPFADSMPLGAGYSFAPAGATELDVPEVDSDDVQFAPPLWRAVGPVVRDIEPVVSQAPDWLRHTSPLEDFEFHGSGSCPSRPRPLVTRARLGQALRSLVSEPRESGHVDEPRLVRQIARCSPPRRVARLKRLAFTRRLQIYWDQSTVMQPCWFDQHDVVDWLRRWRGIAGLEELVVGAGLRPVWRRRVGIRFESTAPRRPDPHTTVLALGDLGSLDGDVERVSFWERVRRTAERARAKRCALVLCPADRWPADLQRRWHVVEWERAGPSAGHGRAAARSSVAYRQSALEGLLVRLAPAIRIEPALLRDMRLAMPRSQANLGTELDAWIDRRTRGRSPCGVTLDYEAAKVLREDFALLADTTKRSIETLLRRHHSGLSSMILAEELLACGTLDGQIDADRIISSYARRLRDNAGPSSVTESAYVDRMTSRQSTAAWRSDRLAAVWALANRNSDGTAFGKPAPDGLDIQRVLWVLEHLPALGWCRLWQRGKSLLAFPISRESAPLSQHPGSLLADIPFRIRHVDVTEYRTNKQTEVRRLAIGEALELSTQMDGAESPIAQVSSDLAQLQIWLQERPVWADSLARDTYGLQLGIGREPESVTMTWPTWSYRIDHDASGLVAELPLAQGVNMRMRWVPPGSFLMGSLDSETGRKSEEGPRHSVVLSGFWLGETLCTQAEWYAVMANDPSRFKGERRPVDHVSWEDCREFCRRLSKTYPTLLARLPTEAEWEYACRAGSSSAYNDGSPCTEAEGCDPALAKLAWFLESSDGKTHAVGALRPNAWGLRDMHGNLLEWCTDWFGNYGAKPVTDPHGPRDGTERVMRGGCWGSHASACRSAYRYRANPSIRTRNFGFRLAADGVEAEGR
jgi:formylglycine-generating enzyme required for sulfatase activity